MTYDVIITCTSFYGQLPTQNFELRRTYGLGVRDTLFSQNLDKFDLYLHCDL